MTAFDPFEREIGQMLSGLAAQRTPVYIDAAIANAVSNSQRRWWTFPERWLPMSVITGKRTLAPALPWRTIGLLALLALLLALVAVIAASNLQRHTVNPYGPASNGSIVFSKSDDIYVADNAGDNEQLIIGGATVDTQPWFSHDGTRIAFSRANEVPTLMVADADGANVVALTPDVITADWSPDSHQLAVIHGGVGNRDVLSVVDADSGNSTRDIDLGAVVPVDWVAWRPPAGKEILFRGRDTTTHYAAIYGVRPDGSGLRTITTAKQQDPTLSFQGPHVSHDGTAIGFSNWEANDAGVKDAWAHILNIDTGVDRRDLEYSQPRFAPAGDLVIGEGVNQLFVGPTDGSSPAHTIGPVYSGQLSTGYDFSPDGAQVLLTTASSQQTYLINVATGDATEMSWLTSDYPGWQRLPR